MEQSGALARAAAAVLRLWIDLTNLLDPEWAEPRICTQYVTCPLSLYSLTPPFPNFFNPALCSCFLRGIGWKLSYGEGGKRI